MPQSTKRTSPHPISLLISCSAPPGSPPLRPCQTPTMCWIHFPLGSQPLGPCLAPAPLRIHAPPRSLSFQPCWAPAPHGMTGSMPRQDPRTLNPSGHQLRMKQLHPSPARTPTTRTLPDPHPASIPTPQATLGTSPMPDPCPAVIPTPEALPGSSCLWDNRSHAPLGSSPLRPQQGPALHGTATSPTPLGPSSTTFPDNQSTRLLLRLPQEDSKPA
jgi:hypothetical protein